MKLKSVSKFKISGLNQERVINFILKKAPLNNLKRLSKLESSFECSYRHHSFIESILKTNNIKILELEHSGLFYNLKTKFSVGFVLAFLIVLIFYPLQYNYIFKYQINGLKSINETEVIDFLTDNFDRNKKNINTTDVEVSMMERFSKISFVSCLIKGQTLVINIKEKIIPNEMANDFNKIIAKKDGKIVKIDLISGTLKVKVGDFVKKGDVLVEPYIIDSSGEMKNIEAKAQIEAEIYNNGTENHFDRIVKTERTGRFVENSDIYLFGLPIYSFKSNLNYQFYEVEQKDVNLSKNLCLPFKMQKTRYYELEQKIIETTFEDCKEKIILLAKQKALEKCNNCDTIIDEFYTIKHIDGVDIVNYCILTQENIGGNYDY